MRRLLLAVAAAALLLAAVAEANEETKEVASVDKVRKGLDILKKLADVFSSDIFKELAVATVASLLSKSIPLAGAILDLLLGPRESAELAEMRRQFAALHRRLDGIDLKLEELERLMEWNRVRAMYADLDLHITNSRRLFDQFANATQEEKDSRQRWFVEFYSQDRHAPTKLFKAILLNYNSIAANLASAVVAYTNSHRRQVMNFLLAMTRLVQRGAQMDVAYERLTVSKQKADALEKEWQRRMEELAYKLKAVEDEVVANWHPAMSADVQRFIRGNGNLDHRSFANSLHAFLAEKFDWRLWVVVAYNEVTGYDKHTVRHCNGVHHFRAGGRNTAVGSSDPRTSRFSRQRAMDAIERANNENRRFVNDGRHWLRIIEAEAGTDCGFSSFRFVARREAAVAVKSNDNRVAVRQMRFIFVPLPGRMPISIFVIAVLFG